MKQTYFFQTYTIYLFFLSCLTIAAQSDQPFRTIKSDYGISSNVVSSVTQDATGFMWFATNGGLFRYDGYEVIPFKSDKSSKNDYSGSYINTCLIGSENKLWAGSSEGLLLFDTSSGQSKIIDLGGKREIRCLLKQGDTTLWVGTSDGLLKFNTSDHSFTLYNQQNSGLSSNIIRSLYMSKKNILWVGTFNGLNKFNTEGSIKTYDFKGNYKPELKNNLILDIQSYSKIVDHLLWIGTETGLVLFNTESERFEIINTQNTNILNEVVKCVYSKVPGQVYFGTDLGFYKYDIDTKKISSSFHNPLNNFSIANNIVSDIFEDNTGVLWLATSNGVSKGNYIQNKFQFNSVYSKYENQIVGAQVNTVYKDENDALWLATTHGVKVLYKDGSTKIFTSKNDEKTKIVLNTVGAITGDALGRIWIGTAGGINIWDPETEKMHTITANFDDNKGLRTNYIASFIKPSDGSFWVSTWGGGIYKVQDDFSNIKDLSFRFIANFNSGGFSAHKKIWIIDNQKIYALDVSTNEVATLKKLNNELKSTPPVSIHISKRGALWIGTSDMLIKYHIQSEKCDRFPINTGKSNAPYNLIEDFSGNIWGTTLTSLFKFDISENAFEIYPKKVGVALDNFLQGSKSIADDGQLFFCGNDGFLSFYPEEISKSDYKPNILITNLSVSGVEINSLNELGKENNTVKQISFVDDIVLEHDQNSIQLKFSALHLAEPEGNIYAYKLEGHDSDWLYTTGNKNYASYANLTSGNYTFQIKGTNNDGVWFEDLTTLNIKIKPSVWAGPIAIGIYTLLFLSLLTFLKNLYNNRLKSKEELKHIKIEKEKNEEIALSKQRLFTNISHEFRTPLTLILGPIDNLLKNNRLNPTDTLLVSLIQKNAKRLLSLINQLLDLRKIETNSLQLLVENFDLIDFCQNQFDLFADLAESKQINYRFEASNQALNFQGDKVRIEAIIQNLLSNAFKFTPEQGIIEFKLTITEQSSIRISVSDTGIGISNDKKDQIFKRFYQNPSNASNTAGYGIGLNITKEYCELMGGKIWFESEFAKGSTFFVEIPNQYSDATQGKVEKIYEYQTTEKKEKPIAVTNINLPTVLLVDDHADTLQFLKINLKEHYEILTANNGKNAFKLLEKHKVNIIVSDIMMDELDGIEFCKKVKQNAKFEHIPVILLTAKTVDSQQLEGFHAGADAYLTKPFSMDVLEIRIKNFLAKRQKIDKHIKQKLMLGNQKVEVQSSDEKLLQETIQYINKHITNTEINLEDMAHTIGVSYSSLYRKVKAQTGMKLNELVRDIKLKKAERLLKTGKLSISEVIYETGFSSHSYFARCFKKQYGVAPKTYSQTKE